MKAEIVKVQVPIGGEGPALVYNKDRTTEVFMETNEEILGLLDGRPKAFFFAYVDEQTEAVMVGPEAPWQDW